MSGLNEAASIRAPRAGEVIELTISTTTQAFLIPVSFAGSYCRWKVFADTGTLSMYIAFGTSTVNVIATSLSTISTGVITPIATTGERVESGTTEHWVMPPIVEGSTTHFAVDATAAGRLQIIRAAD